MNQFACVHAACVCVCVYMVWMHIVRVGVPTLIACQNHDEDVHVPCQAYIIQQCQVTTAISYRKEGWSYYDAWKKYCQVCIKSVFLWGGGEVY